MQKDYHRIEAILFDLDDTLINWAHPTVSREEYFGPRVERLRSHLTALGYELPLVEQFKEILDLAVFATWEEAKKSWVISSFGDVLCQVLEDLGLASEGLDQDELLEVFGWDPWPGVILFPDTRAVLEELRRKEYKIGLLTNSFLPMWMRDKELEAYDLLHFFDARVTAADIGFVKPHPNIYHALLDRLGVTPAQAIFVGDRPQNDIAGANAVGLVSILMDPPHLDRELGDIVPDYAISRLSDLLPILVELEQANSAESE